MENQSKQQRNDRIASLRNKCNENPVFSRNSIQVKAKIEKNMIRDALAYENH
jgi:hypothetical protein